MFQGGEVTPICFFIFFSWVEIRLHTKVQLPRLLRSGSFIVGDTTGQVSMKLMASLAPAQAEIEAGVVAKADQKFAIFFFVFGFLGLLNWSERSACNQRSKLR